MNDFFQHAENPTIFRESSDLAILQNLRTDNEFINIKNLIHENSRWYSFVASFPQFEVYTLYARKQFHTISEHTLAHTKL